MLCSCSKRLQREAPAKDTEAVVVSIDIERSRSRESRGTHQNVLSIDNIVHCLLYGTCSGLRRSVQRFRVAPAHACTYTAAGRGIFPSKYTAQRYKYFTRFIPNIPHFQNIPNIYRYTVYRYTSLYRYRRALHMCILLRGTSLPNPCTRPDLTYRTKYIHSQLSRPTQARFYGLLLNVPSVSALI
jgi:hypothetical protein